MQVAKHWTVDIHLTEHSDEDVVRTHAEARLHTQESTDLRGRATPASTPLTPMCPRSATSSRPPVRCRTSRTSSCTRPQRTSKA